MYGKVHYQPHEEWKKSLPIIHLIEDQYLTQPSSEKLSFTLTRN